MMDKVKRKNDDTEKIRLWTWKRAISVMLMALVYGLIALATAMHITGAFETVYISFLLGVPLAIGALSIYTIPPELRNWTRVFWMSFLTTMLFALTAGIYQPIIWLCIIMATPMVFIAAFISSFIMLAIDKYYRQHKRKNQYGIALFVMLLPYFLAPFEANIDPSAWNRSVENEVIIYNTTPEEVWENVINVAEITSVEQRPTWYQGMGIPRPVEASIDYEGIGGIRTGEFEFGLIFYEEVVLWEEYQAVDFTVDVMVNPQSTPVLRQIGGAYFDVLGTGYEIEAIDESTVILRLHSDYRLSTNFNFYGAFWSDWIMKDFQNYILQTIKTRVEQG